ncbi:MAG: endo alpha-1,4 polygalactosaminidase [Candidatus Vogelbacteria bacterium]|nr:endo alpha-1,4 polygalactosaminidase [Candidatus Vogelbacteria bacterium]
MTEQLEGAVSVSAPVVGEKEAVVSPAAASAWWKPKAGILWQIQFAKPPIDTAANPELFDVDLYDTPQSVIDELHKRGQRVICYINMGAWENWREDKGDYPAAVLGKDYQGWPGEKWVDIRAIDSLAPILRRRMDLCKSKGFDGVEPDNVNGYQNDTGFPLTADDQLKFNRFIANEAHKRGLAIGLKNDNEQVGELVDSFDWVVTEGCASDGWCYDMKPFLDKGKPVLQIEYTDTDIKFQNVCGGYVRDGFSPILKNRELDGWVEQCKK